MKSPLRLRKSLELLWVAACLAATPLAADELMNNADFSKGSENWKGDFDSDSNEGDPFKPTSNQVTLNLRSKHAIRIFQVFQADTDAVTCTATFTPSSDVQYTGSAIVKDVASDVTEQQIASTSYNAGTNTITEVTNPNYATYTTSFNSPVIIITDADDNQVSLYREQGAPGSTVPTVSPMNPTGPSTGSPSAPIAPAPTMGGQTPTTPSTPAPSDGQTITGQLSGTTAGTPINVIAHLRVKPHRAYRLYLAFPPGQGSITVSKISVQTSP